MSSPERVTLFGKARVRELETALRDLRNLAIDLGASDQAEVVAADKALEPRYDVPQAPPSRAELKARVAELEQHALEFQRFLQDGSGRALPPALVLLLERSAELVPDLDAEPIV